MTPLALFDYRTKAHTSTGTSCRQTDFSPAQANNTITYQSHLQAKLAEMQGFIKTNLVATNQ